jgi:hypothetical protein
MEAHGAVGRLQPAPDAEPEVRREFHQRSAQVYALIAEIDRGHHHEAMYWANRERAKAEDIGQELRGRSDAASA